MAIKRLKKKMKNRDKDQVGSMDDALWSPWRIAFGTSVESCSSGDDSHSNVSVGSVGDLPAAMVEVVSGPSTSQQVGPTTGHLWANQGTWL